jgi:peptidoglycan hydrolase-like protein with peptidoglycan-binding domain
MRAGLLAALASLLAALVLTGTASASVPKPGFAALQVALRDRGLYGGHIDGIPGPMTVRAVKRFQRKKRLVVDGIAGPQTVRALGRYGRHRLGDRLLHLGKRGWDVAALQFLLRRRGVPVSAIDGDFGPGTQRSVIRFQASRGLTADGVVGRQTRRALWKRRASGGQSRSAPASRAHVKRTINHWARHYGVSPALARALAWIESGFQPHVRSSSGAAGVMQVTGPTWNFVETFIIGRNVPRTTSGNIRIGVAYLDFLLRDFRGRQVRALCAYNQGPWSVRERGCYDDARRFARTVLAMRGRV